MPECFDFCMENPSDMTTCGSTGAICTKMFRINIAHSGTIPDEELLFGVVLGKK